MVAGERHMLSVYTIIGGDVFNHLVMVTPMPAFFILKVLFPLVINQFPDWYLTIRLFYSPSSSVLNSFTIH